MKRFLLLLSLFACCVALPMLYACGGESPSPTPLPSATTAPVSTATPLAPEPTATPLTSGAATSTALPLASPSSIVTPQAAATVKPERIDQARTFISQLDKGDFTGAEANFDATMKSKLPPEQLRAAWQQIIGQAGAFQSQGSVRTQSASGYDAVIVTCAFEKANLDVRVVFDAQAQIAGLFFAPAQTTSGTASPTVAYSPPSYVNRSAFTERDVTVGSGQWALPGTLSMPNGSGPFPGVVLVQGSGPQDRDETTGPNKPFRDIAWGLASKGIAVLRYDKRTFVYAQRMAQSVNSVTVKDEVVDDALAALDLLRKTTGVAPSRVYLLGHSLGALLAPMVAQSDPQLAGMVLLAGPSRPLEDVILDQETYLAQLGGTVTPDVQNQLNIIRQQVQRIKDPNLSPSVSREQLPLNIPAAYWLSLRGYDQVQIAKSLNKPMLILQGERDYQVTMTDFKGWQDALAGQPNVMLKSYPALNHLFMSGQGKPNPSEYNEPGHVDATVMQDISAWLKR